MTIEIRKVLTFLLHPTFLVIPFAVLVWIFIPGIHGRYKADLQRTIVSNPEELFRHNYEDLNNDGYSELIRSGYFKGKSFLTISDDKNVTKQFNFNGFFPPNGNRFMFGKYTNDSVIGIFAIITNNDSLFMYFINDIESDHYSKKKIFLSLMPNAKEISWSIPEIFLHDLDGDKSKEVLVLVSAGFQKKPRRVFAYNISRDTLIQSPDIGAQPLDMYLYTKDGKARIAVSNYASCNYADTTRGMHDNNSYRIILDERLQFAGIPKKEYGDYCAFEVIPIYYKQDTFMLEIVVRTKGDKGLHLIVRDLAGKALHYRKVNYDRDNLAGFRISEDRDGNSIIIGFYVFDKLVLMNHELEIVKTRKVKLSAGLWNSILDIDNDGDPEMFFNSMTPGEIVIFKYPLVSPAKINPGNGYMLPVNIIKRGNQPPEIMVQINENIYEYRYYAQSPLIPISYLIATYLFFFGFAMLIWRIHLTQLRKRYKLLQTLNELKFLTIRNQMDPHFTFNIMNTVGSFILQKKPEESYKMLMDYSKFLRNTLNSCENLLGTLEEEIEFVLNYLNLQKLRFKEKLSFSISIAPDIDKMIIVPRMAIYTYVENALKHGIGSLSEGGTIDIQVQSDGSFLYIIVIDNGVGRSKAAEKESDSGKGLKIMHQLYTLLNESNKTAISEEILDLIDDEGNPAGTEVRLKISTGLKQ